MFFCKNGFHQVVLRQFVVEEGAGMKKRSPDVVLIGEDDDHAGVGVFTQATDHLVKLPRSRLAWDLH